MSTHAVGRGARAECRARRRRRRQSRAARPDGATRRCLTRRRAGGCRRAGTSAGPSARCRRASSCGRCGRRSRVARRALSPSDTRAPLGCDRSSPRHQVVVPPDSEIESHGFAPAARGESSAAVETADVGPPPALVRGDAGGQAAPAEPYRELSRDQVLRNRCRVRAHVCARPRSPPVRSTRAVGALRRVACDCRSP
jgi:hypothetical protein